LLAYHLHAVFGYSIIDLGIAELAGPHFGDSFEDSPEEADDVPHSERVRLAM